VIAIAGIRIQGHVIAILVQNGNGIQLDCHPGQGSEVELQIEFGGGPRSAL
jgi:hypothetical protein